MGFTLRRLSVVGALCALGWPLPAAAGEMDLALARLRIGARPGVCVGVAPDSGYCPDNEAFERLVSELSVALAPSVASGAATVGPAGFYLGVSSTLTPISSDRRYWVRGSRGHSASVGAVNASPAGQLVWNRLEIRKGLPFGFEIGSAMGQGWDTSMWVFSGQVRWALLEGFHSGLGMFPDVAVRGVLQTSFGSSQLSLQTHAVDLTLSKPFVVLQRARITPLLGVQALFVRGQSGRVDLTPEISALGACGAIGAAAAGSEDEVSCQSDAAAADLENNVVFAKVRHTRVRLFLGTEAEMDVFRVGLSLGFDLAAPELDASTPGDGESGGLARQVSFQLALGVRY